MVDKQDLSSAGLKFMDFAIRFFKYGQMPVPAAEPGKSE